jgi:hypothetical protein
MNIRSIISCFEKRRKTKGEVWDRNIPLTTASRHVRAHADQEAIYHGVDLHKCSVCGSISESGLVDLAHIIAASSFNDDTPLGVINHIYNLLPLCKNCHRKNDSIRHDKNWVDHRRRVLAALKKQNESVIYLCGGGGYLSPVNLEKLSKQAENPLRYLQFFPDDEHFVIRNTGENYYISDDKLYEFRDKMMGELIRPDNRNGMSYYDHRNHAKSEAYRHNMYNDMRCLICGENAICDLSHANRLCDIPKNIPLGVVNHVHNLIWLCPNHNHLLDHPPGKKVNDQYRREYDGFIKLLQQKLILHREKFNQIPIRKKRYLFNPVSLGNWQIVGEA